MPKGILLSDTNLDAITINDFTPGIFRGNFANPVYSTETPMGSASRAFRCIARPGIGLIPLPSYASATIVNNAVTYTAVCALAGIGSTAFNAADQLLVSYINSAGLFHIDSWSGNGDGSLSSNGNKYSHSSGLGDVGMVCNPIIPFFGVSAGPLYNLVGLTIDPSVAVANQVTWVTVPAWDSNSVASRTGTITLPLGGAVETWGQPFVQGSRAGFILPFSIGSIASGAAGIASGVWTGDIQAMTNITGPEFFEPSDSNIIGAFGSVSTGEFVVIYQSGGAVVVSGDVQSPSSAIKLPAVVGTGRAVGPAVPSPVGLVYVTDYDGVYAWNGGNTAQKLSLQLPDTSFLRSQYTADQTFPYESLPSTTHHDVWNDWVLFANNYLFDTEGGGWWQIEDPSIANFQVLSNSHLSSQFFYATDGFTTAASPLKLYMLNKAVPASTYVWTSNPLPSPGGIVSIQTVEICASNTSATSCTITVTPTSPPAQTLFTNTPQAQPMVFTIPANTAGYRASLRCGYADYNVCISVAAANSNVNNPAPTLHEITCGIDKRPSSIA